MAPARVRLARLPGVVRKSFAAIGAVKEVGMAPGRLDKAKAPGCGHARLASYKGQIRANLGRRDATELTQARDLGSGLYGRNQSPPCVDPNVPMREEELTTPEGPSGASGFRMSGDGGASRNL